MKVKNTFPNHGSEKARKEEQKRIYKMLVLQMSCNNNTKPALHKGKVS